jgi:hypothetical protein
MTHLSTFACCLSSRCLGIMAVPNLPPRTILFPLVKTSTRFRPDGKNSSTPWYLLSHTRLNGSLFILFGLCVTQLKPHPLFFSLSLFKAIWFWFWEGKKKNILPHDSEVFIISSFSLSQPAGISSHSILAISLAQLEVYLRRCCVPCVCSFYGQSSVSYTVTWCLFSSQGFYFVLAQLSAGWLIENECSKKK